MQRAALAGHAAWAVMVIVVVVVMVASLGTRGRTARYESVPLRVLIEEPLPPPPPREVSFLGWGTPVAGTPLLIVTWRWPPPGLGLIMA